ncbi:hypothetical protein MTHERMMSTA1_14600 [Methanosarcina thermophila MST-A1]|jgi:hypothetical protein|uniref:Uncharacterized protein n=1 Tax=Methanosarcina thermophila TaxID=2210 RepID=A0A3G9CQR8_METTE|nr:MAG: hypothetical protein AAY43_00560 [Methanosarcina sp. 795]BAW28094.1 hypothetical protein MESMT1_0164 [Methanosarcina thermophila]GLI14334.1 hypothetical protein MTHERMMSTA1_14600 [Methanosarcina thermophila MST-A1]
MNLACQSIKNFLLFWLRNSNPSEDVNPEVKVFLIAALSNLRMGAPAFAMFLLKNRKNMKINI